MKVTIEVTQQDIDNGEPCQGAKCAVALAVRRALPGSNAWVDPVCITLDNDRAVPKRRIITPDSVARFIRNFDNSEPVNPFSFDLEV